MAWVKLDDRFPRHPKSIQVGPLGRDLFVCGLCYCGEHLTDGFIADRALLTLAPGLRDTVAKRLADELVAARFWERDDVRGGYQVHDYADWQPSGDRVRDDRRAAKARKEAWRSRRSENAKGTPFHTRSKRVPVPSLERKENASPSRPVPSRPVPPASNEAGAVEPEPPSGFSDFWANYPNKAGKEAARKAWQRLHPDATLRARLCEAVAAQRLWPKWVKDGGEYIPHASSWLNGRRWEDEPPEVAASVFTPKTAGNQGVMERTIERIRRGELGS